MDLVNRLESSLEHAFVRGVRAASPGAKILKLVVPSQAGFPDRLLLLPGGATVLVELKRDGERLRKLQEHRRNELAELGHTVMVVSNKVELEHLLNLIRRVR